MKNIFKFALCYLLALAASPASPFFFGLNYVAPPSGCTTISSSYSSSATPYDSFDTAGHTYVATAFTSSGSGAYCKVEVELKKNNSPTGTITAYLYSNNSGQPGTLLATSTSTLNAATLTSSYVYYSFDISYSRSAGTVYWIVLGKSSVSGTHYAVWNGGGAGTRYTSSDASTWTFGASVANNFKIYE